VFIGAFCAAPFSGAHLNPAVTVAMAFAGKLEAAKAAGYLAAQMLGGTTGYAIDPARDPGPRLAHALLPVPGKRDRDWSYAWVPVLGPLLGAAPAAGVHLALR
jgi:glycerol uptake facilitator-like aquaporin